MNPWIKLFEGKRQVNVIDREILGHRRKPRQQQQRQYKDRKSGITLPLVHCRAKGSITVAANSPPKLGEVRTYAAGFLLFLALGSSVARGNRSSLGDFHSVVSLG